MRDCITNANAAAWPYALRHQSATVEAFSATPLSWTALTRLVEEIAAGRVAAATA
jgi:hypothetical protein